MTFWSQVSVTCSEYPAAAVHCWRCALRAGTSARFYSPVDAVELARKFPDRHVVFFAVGFETTTPATALAALQAEQLGLENFSLLVAHVRVQPAMEALMNAPANRVQGFLAAGTRLHDYRLRPVS